MLSWLLPSLALAQTQTHGQIVGEVTDSSVIVWTRASQPCLVSVLHATTPTMAGAVETAQLPALASRDTTVRVPVSGLLPATQYYFRMRLSTTVGSGGTLGPIGSFRTAPAPQQLAPVRFAFSGDTNDKSQFGIFSAIAGEQPDFFLNLGDFPYCDGSVSLLDYWNEHRAIRDEPQLQLLTNDVPWIFTWDDHEVSNNWDAAMSPTLVQNGAQGFRDWTPLPDGPQDIWRRLRFGKGMELFVLDTRRYRDLNAALPSPQKTLLGQAQLQWLQQALLDSDAIWKVIATSVPTFYGGIDSWDGFVHERQQLLDFLLASDLHNVVFLAADQHIAAIRELRCGLLELQTGPLAQFVGGNTWRREPEQRWHGTVRNFAVVTVDPTVTPCTLHTSFRDQNGAVLREHVATAIDAPAKLTVRSDVPEGGFVLAEGPHLVRDEGSLATRERLRPGSYRLLGRDLAHGSGGPATLDLDVPSGADVRIATSYEDVPGANAVLFADHFDAPFGASTGWSVVDLGTDGPSSWLVCDRTLTQRSNIGGGGPVYGGTLALAGDPAWTDVTLRARCYEQDNDSCGVVFRFVNALNYYRVRFDNERQLVQLTRVANGVATMLAERTAQPGFVPMWWFEVTVAAIGDHLRVWQDGELLFDVHDAAHTHGRIGLYSWASQWVAFDDVVVRQGDATGLGRAPIFAADFANGSLSGFQIVDQGTTSGPSQWSVQNGELRQDANIEDGDGSRTGLPKLGTLLLAPGLQGDQELRVRLRNDDDDAIGVVLRYQSPSNHYRFSMDAQRHYRRLVKVVGGQWTTLWESDDDYPPGVWQQLSFSAQGDRLRVGLNGMTLCDVRDASLTLGRAGLYCWASQGARFDDLRVQAPPRPRAVTAAIATAGQTRLELCGPESAGSLYLLALSSATAPGIPLASLQPGDPRVWALNWDVFFQLCLTPNPLLLDFGGTLDADGRATATVLWPPVVSQLLGGATLYAGGITFDTQSSTWGELFPTVPLTIPR
ncbi:MAG: alkaline phosphatase D family protein [Planctomycetota bacterium]